ncbi:hypothetical protein ACP275_04G222900 [Erythranthe tilingii]
MPVRKNMKNNLIPSSPMKVVHLQQEEEAQMKQGIVTILGSDFCHGNKPGGASIRRTLSADMSSKKWLQQNGFFSPAVKKIPSSSSSSSSPPPSPPSSSSSSSSSESEEEYEEITAPGQDDVWRAIQAKKERDDEEMKKKKPLQMDVWGTMLTHKSENSAALLAAAAAAPPPPPYVHPLVKRSASTLSEKSLEICTESLGSETGSDCFSAETEDQEKVVVMPVVVGDSNDHFADTHVAKYKKSPARPFPPPLPSITGGDGAALHVQSHRENGRLVLEAVSVPQRNHFHAQRCAGRLVLTLAHAPPACELTLVEEVFDNMEDVDEDVVTAEEEEEEKVDDGGGNEGYVAAEENFFQAQSPRKEKEYMVEQNLSLPSGMMSLNKSRMVIKKLMAVGNMNPKWSQNLNKSDQVAVAEEVFAIPQSLPPPPRVARMIPSPAVAEAPAAASFNAYEYFWRNKTAVYGGGGGTQLKNKNGDGGAEAAYENKDLVVVKGKKTEYSVPYLRGCKEARRSLSIWEPYCIATS